MSKSERGLEGELYALKVAKLIADLEKVFAEHEVGFRTAAEASATVLSRIGTLNGRAGDAVMVEIVARPAYRYEVPPLK